MMDKPVGKLKENDVKRQKYRRTVQTIERKKNKQAGRQIYP